MPVRASTTTAKAQIGYVPQDVSLYPDLTARENQSFFGRLYRLSGSALRDRVDEVLDLIDLTDRRDDRVESFSGEIDPEYDGEPQHVPEDIGQLMAYVLRALRVVHDRCGFPEASTEGCHLIGH